MRLQSYVPLYQHIRFAIVPPLDSSLARQADCLLTGMVAKVGFLCAARKIGLSDLNRSFLPNLRFPGAM